MVKGDSGYPVLAIFVVLFTSIIPLSTSLHILRTPSLPESGEAKRSLLADSSIYSEATNHNSLLDQSDKRKPDYSLHHRVKRRFDDDRHRKRNTRRTSDTNAKNKKDKDPNLFFIPLFFGLVFLVSMVCRCCTWIKEDIREHDAKIDKILSDSTLRLEYADKLDASEKKLRKKKNLKVIQLPDMMYDNKKTSSTSSSSSCLEELSDFGRPDSSSCLRSQHQRRSQRNHRSYHQQHLLQIPSSLGSQCQGHSLRRVASVCQRGNNGLKRVPSNKSAPVFPRLVSSHHLQLPDLDFGGHARIARFTVGPADDEASRTAQWVSSTRGRRVYRIVSVEEYDDSACNSQCSSCGRAMSKRLSTSMGVLPSQPDCVDSGIGSSISPPNTVVQSGARRECLIVPPNRRRHQSCRIKHEHCTQSQSAHKHNQMDTRDYCS